MCTVNYKIDGAAYSSWKIQSFLNFVWPIRDAALSTSAPIPIYSLLQVIAVFPKIRGTCQ